MDYEKKYKETLEKARQLCAYPTTKPFISDLQDLFSELKESEDERIVKCLLNYFHHVRYNGLDLKGTDVDEVIAWLEKQSETKQVTDFSNLKTWKLIVDAILTKENGIGQYLDSARTETLAKELLERFGNIEQKIVVKIKPKFKVGDWVVLEVDELSSVLKITKIDEHKKMYWFHDGSYLPIVDDDCLRFWTIYDAKDGDVLCTYECGEPKIIFILKGTPKKHCALSFHCYYNIMCPYFKSDSNIGCLAPNDEDVKPATEEQRDLLFQKMKEAGYEL